MRTHEGSSAYHFWHLPCVCGQLGMALGVCVKVIDTHTCRHVHRETEEEDGEDVWVRPQGFSISSSLGDGYQWQHVIGIMCELEGCYH